jgi:predicted ATP-grasp superfamily ATP-dependent carboligase
MQIQKGDAHMAIKDPTMSTIPAVVFPADRPASLGIARSLGRRGIQVYGVDINPLAYAMASRYVTPCFLQAQHDSEEYRLHFLLDLGKRLGGKAVLYAVSDDTVMLASQYRDQLQEYYHYVMPDHNTVSSLLTKDGLHRVAQAHGIPDPQLFHPKDYQEVQNIAGRLSYPVIIKPVFSPSWLRPEIDSLLRDNALSGGPKVALCKDAEGLMETYRKLAAYDSRLIIQEVIPGEDKRLVYFCFYMDRQSKPLAIFAGEKIRVLPVGFGSASFVRTFRDPELEEVSLKLLSAARYQGLGGIEFKRDSRDECYKLIEFNARLGMWDSLSARCGIDIPFIAYCDALCEPVQPKYEYREGVLWVDFQRDVRAFLIYRKRGLLSFAGWLRSLAGEKEWAVYSGDDWKPALIAFREFLQRLMDMFKNRLPFLHNNRSRFKGF